MNKKRNIVKLIIAVLISNLFFAGCYTQIFNTKNEQHHNIERKKQKRSIINSKNVPINKYPTINPTDVQIDKELEMKMRLYLYDKYRPGSCFGMPGPDDDRMVKNTLDSNPELVKIINDKYQVYNDNRVYKIWLALGSFTFYQASEGYKFAFVDGDYCTITKYEGILYMENDEIIESEITNKEIFKVPC